MRPAGVQGCDPDGAVPRGRGALASAPQSFAPGGIPGRPVRSLGGVNRFMVGEGGRIRGGKAGASEQATLPESSMPNAGRRQQWCHTYLEYIVVGRTWLRAHVDGVAWQPSALLNEELR
ncbi:hypothetical protein CYMTET_41977 [Cymbomonas tetramitiformis]|uniref:Uncharacterized protein n=1 Tax=Cymbomonas tetramitiformis TaxID=36881 RepID=A0AAE0C526_9CHLO|nr:hypothetical protein CYMTET_41977 [Cymbomonas tetramitiformis]